jgi:integrase/recombinase XerD
MNRRPPGLLLSQAISGFLQFKTAEGLSPNTLAAYSQHLYRWLKNTGDIDVSRITTQNIRDYLVWLRAEYQPRRLNGDDQPLSSKTIRNVHITFSSLFSWLEDEFHLPDPMKGVPAPRFELPPIEPLKKEEIEALLKACEFCNQADTKHRRRFVMRRATGRRDQAIILTLLDTGLRASELCALKVGDVDQRTGKVQVKHGRHGGAKGGKGRTVFLGKAARRALWRYLAEREDGEDPDAPLFLGKFSRPINKNSLRLMLSALGKKAQVVKCYPHRFRHTFAISYLRAGGDLFTLQALLGHTTLDMVQHYARIAEIDVEQAHRRASPADNWRL